MKFLGNTYDPKEPDAKSKVIRLMDETFEQG